MPSYTPLSSGEMELGSGVILPSGEANFADFNTQVPDYYDGINLNYEPSGSVLFLEEPSGAYASDYGSGSGLFEQGHFKFVRTPIDLTLFNPYIHYYPRSTSVNLSPYVQTIQSNPFYVDYSLVFEIADYYNTYGSNNYLFDDVDTSGNPLFPNSGLIPPGIL